MKAQMVQQPAKYYQKVEALSQQAALASQPPAQANLSNPPPLWGPKFLLSTSGSACWTPTRLELCPHASTFSCCSEHFRLLSLAATALKHTHPEWLLTVLLCFCVYPLKKKKKNPLYRIPEGDDTLKSAWIQIYSSVGNVHVCLGEICRKMTISGQTERIDLDSGKNKHHLMRSSQPL